MPRHFYVFATIYPSFKTFFTLMTGRRHGIRKLRLKADCEERPENMFGKQIYAVLALSAVFLTGTSALAEDFVDQRVDQAMDKAESAEIKALQEEANGGDASAQLELGTLYQNGQGVPQDNAKAAELWTKAANQGLAAAQFNLGLLYQNGDGVPKDTAKAAEWYQKAADQGDAEAQFSLALLYVQGQGVKKSPPEAARLYQKAADQGHEKAKKGLEGLYQQHPDLRPKSP
ncbi:sel1 repeat family protein [Acetobacteraceae bacterium]|nr:sel1 repeat family protein [Acetobacteraceae bacterium]